MADIYTSEDGEATVDLQAFSKRYDQIIAELLAENERLLVLATKWCDKDHHDWQEILEIAEKGKN